MKPNKKQAAKGDPAASTPPRAHVSIMASPRLMRVLIQMAEAYKAAPDKDALAVPYIITCAAALEAKLNDALASHATSVWGEHSQPIRQALLSMSFRGKLETIVILLTREQFRLNPDDEYVKRLHSLISYRNLLVHPKPTAHEITMQTVPHPLDGTSMSIFGDEYLKLAEDLTFGAKNIYTPPEYHEAISKLEKWFFMRVSGDLSKIRLLKTRNLTTEP